MKTILFLLSALSCLGQSLLAAPRPVTFVWTPPTNGVPDIYVLYQTTNLFQPLTNWAPILTIPGTNTTCQLTLIPGAYCFTMTASNFWGESPFSNLAGTPAPIGAGSGLRVRLSD